MIPSRYRSVVRRYHEIHSCLFCALDLLEATVDSYGVTDHVE